MKNMGDLERLTEHPAIAEAVAKLSHVRFNEEWFDAKIQSIIAAAVAKVVDEPLAWAVMQSDGRYDYRLFGDRTEAEDYAQSCEEYDEESKRPDVWPLYAISQTDEVKRG